MYFYSLLDTKSFELICCRVVDMSNMALNLHVFKQMNYTFNVNPNICRNFESKTSTEKKTTTNFK